MIVDSSAIICLILEEPEQAEILMKLRTARVRRLSAGTWIELAAVIGRRKLTTFEHLAAVVDDLQLLLEAVTAEQARIGHEAYRVYGLGSAHPARLNFGDCFAYALAKATGEPLLFKGDDFIHTDIVSAIERS